MAFVPSNVHSSIGESCEWAAHDRSSLEHDSAIDWSSGTRRFHEAIE
jgi:hypothetical protein